MDIHLLKRHTLKLESPINLEKIINGHIQLYILRVKKLVGVTFVKKIPKKLLKHLKKFFILSKKKSKDGTQFEIKDKNKQPKIEQFNKKLFKELRKKYKV